MEITITTEWELEEDQSHRMTQEDMTTIVQEQDHAPRVEGVTHPEDMMMIIEITQERGTGTEDTQREATAEKEERTLTWTGIGRPAMATKGDIERVARNPQVMGDLL